MKIKFLTVLKKHGNGSAFLRYYYIEGTWRTGGACGLGTQTFVFYVVCVIRYIYQLAAGVGRLGEGATGCRGRETGIGGDCW